MPLASPSRDLLPAPALLHPLWLGALAVLALNDHVLKGSGLLPDVVTGKLSDFAGLVMAPVLLATVTRVRGRRGWAMAHLAVGVVFSAIQLSTTAASWWSGLMGTIAMPWVIVSDPTDLVALPMLVVSHRVFGRATQEKPLRLLQRSAQLAAGGVGLLCCIATSPPPEGVRFQDLFGTIYLHNESDEEIVVRVRPLLDTTELVCEEVAKDPGRLLTAPLFGAAQSWTLAPDANMTVLDEASPVRGCHAVLVEADDLPPAILFWGNFLVPESWIPGQGIEPSARGWVSIELDEDGEGRTYRSELDIVFEPGDENVEVGGQCGPQPDRNRIDWSDRPAGSWVLQGLEEGVDGCLALDLVDAFELENPEAGRRMYLCVPPASFPFVAGDRLDIDVDGRWVPGAEVLVMSLLDAEGYPANPSLTMVAARGHAPKEPGLLGIDLVYHPDYACEMTVDEGCGTVTRPVEVLADAWGVEPASLRPGESALFTWETQTIELWIPWAEELLALEPSCEGGTDQLGLDVELVAIVQDL